MNILFLIIFNVLLPIIGYGIAGTSSMIFMIVIVLIVDYVAIVESFKNRVGDSHES